MVIRSRVQWVFYDLTKDVYTPQCGEHTLTAVELRESVYTVRQYTSKYYVEECGGVD